MNGEEEEEEDEYEEEEEEEEHQEASEFVKYRCLNVIQTCMLACHRYIGM